MASGLGKAGRCECGLVWLSPRIGGCGALKSTGVLVQLDVGWTHPKAKSGFLAGLCAGGGAGTMGPGRAGTVATWALGLTLALGLEPSMAPQCPQSQAQAPLLPSLPQKKTPHSVSPLGLGEGCLTPVRSPTSLSPQDLAA